jgi:hypothetical protein
MEARQGCRGAADDDNMMGDRRCREAGVSDVRRYV